jgi:hypothetical protein
VTHIDFNTGFELCRSVVVDRIKIYSPQILTDLHRYLKPGFDLCQSV